MAAGRSKPGSCSQCRYRDIKWVLPGIMQVDILHLKGTSQLSKITAHPLVLSVCRSERSSLTVLLSLCVDFFFCPWGWTALCLMVLLDLRYTVMSCLEESFRVSNMGWWCCLTCCSWIDTLLVVREYQRSARTPQGMSWHLSNSILMYLLQNREYIINHSHK